jgi:hypothetical protein
MKTDNTGREGEGKHEGILKRVEDDTDEEKKETTDRTRMSTDIQVSYDVS